MISVIIPIYNQEKFIKKCLASIVNQTYRELEVIMVNDGSTDKSEEVCREFLDDSRFKYIKQKNAGVSVARNTGLKNANGEWVAFVDPDDYLSEEYFSLLLNNSDDNIPITICCCTAFNDNENIKNYFFKDSFDAENNEDKKKLFMQLMNCDYGQPQKSITAVGVPWGKLYKTELIRKYNLSFNPKLKRQQDNIFNMHAFGCAERIRYINLPLYYYRMDNITNYIVSKYDKNAYDYFTEFQKERYNFLTENQFFKSSEIEISYYNEAFNQMIKIINSQILHDENSDSMKNKKQKIIELLNQQYYKNAVNHLKTYEINIKQYKIIYILMKHKYVNGLVMVWNLKKLLDRLKNK